MNLLPKEHEEFSKEKYWNEFFSKTQAKPFEWYGEYDNLCEILDKYIRTKEKILVVGCGNSRLSTDLYDVGFVNITSIDISATVIKQMKAKYQKDRPSMSFEKMDLLEMSFDGEDFTVVLDKGTLDAIMVDSSDETDEKVNTMFSEISRVLKFGGRYICVSLLQQHILHKLLDWFTEQGWMVRVHRCFEAEKSHGTSVTFPVFVVVLTKMKKFPGSKGVLELAIHPESSPKRVDTKDEITESVKLAQHFALLKYNLNKRKLVDDDISLELCCRKTGLVKYRIYVVDLAQSASLKFAVFIVPQGRETEWLFSTSKGRKQLASSANCERLLVVHLLRDFKYESLDEVKKDLSSKVMELAPSVLKAQVPFLSVGDDVGHRELKASGTSEISGDYVVEDVTGDDNQIFRRLIFLSNPYLVQSEAKLVKVLRKKRKKKKEELEIDFSYLACSHHAAMVSGLAFLNSEKCGLKILQIGLGGGSLAMYLFQHVKNVKLDVVELDPAVAAVAKEWFGIVTDERFVIHIADGISFIQEAASKGVRYDAVMLDVDGKDPSLGMSCPPPSFMETSLLQLIMQLVSPNGIAVINLVCRNTSLRNEVISRIKSVFTFVLVKDIPDEVNEILYCLNSTESGDFWVDGNYGNVNSKNLRKQSQNKHTFDISELMSSVETIT